MEDLKELNKDNETNDTNNLGSDYNNDTLDS